MSRIELMHWSLSISRPSSNLDKITINTPTLRFPLGRMPFGFFCTLLYTVDWTRPSDGAILLQPIQRLIGCKVASFCRMCYLRMCYYTREYAYDAAVHFDSAYSTSRNRQIRMSTFAILESIARNWIGKKNISGRAQCGNNALAVSSYQLYIETFQTLTEKFFWFRDKLKLLSLNCTSEEPEEIKK